VTAMTERTATSGAGGESAPDDTTGGPPVTTRGAQTRQLIRDTALRMFKENGYAATSMRAVAREAGVAVGNAYYYFPSKEHLILRFYDDAQAEHRAAAAPVLAGSTDFATRFAGVLHAGIRVNTPHHAFATSFFKVAADPDSPLSPFSTESEGAREASVALFRDVLDGSTIRVDPDLRAQLPELMWLAYMGVILYWVHDRSPDQHKTHLLIDRATPLVARLIGMSRWSMLRPLTREGLDLLAHLRHR
jgi:AcrR family transcriptional regulator